MPRQITIIRDKELKLIDNKIEGFMEGQITKFGNGGKIGVPKEFIKRRAYVVICK